MRWLLYRWHRRGQPRVTRAQHKAGRRFARSQQRVAYVPPTSAEGYDPTDFQRAVLEVVQKLGHADIEDGQRA